MIKNKILNTIKDYNMMNSKDSPIVVGFSGGPDSVCLLHFLKTNFNNKVMAVHINHGLRGEESERDEKFVRDFCSNFKIKLYVKNEKIKNFSEEKGRKIRYEFFDKIAQKLDAKIATAHTLSDSCETLILNLTRGTGLKGLCGIPPVRGKIIRPLIFLTRSEIENYIKENNLSYITDNSNFSEKYTRNKIRIGVIPILKEINPNFENAVQKLILSNQKEEHFLDNISKKAFFNSKIDGGFDVKILIKLSETLKFRVAVKILKYFSPEKQPENYHAQKVVEIIDGKIKAAEIPGKVRIFRKNNILKI